MSLSAFATCIAHSSGVKLRPCPAHPAGSCCQQCPAAASAPELLLLLKGCTNTQTPVCPCLSREMSVCTCTSSWIHTDLPFLNVKVKNIAHRNLPHFRCEDEDVPLWGWGKRFPVFFARCYFSFLHEILIVFFPPPAISSKESNERICCLYLDQKKERKKKKSLLSSMV